ncbi:matrix metalloproteinase-18 isoform X1 [Poecilia reticulata]|uniref:matrix metalloproteinase-18 isoform X1 n=1 Tax=Poecilia reticulata TaxID=8081 RepID=UPI0004A4E834|nr:PREDICTED: matrix metalloproteinase-18-like isoform X1 [Poecilia reticulata]XP_017163948.1 PREDICTED: matrix metalloproteinase-18-like isoform X1 [Poecilia reticulata]XP_017163949.1 PREDICTED: matrix metalloproteinase-18-like isoform X1 [Poecilia reticulata]
MNLLCMTFLTLMKLNQSLAGASPLHIPTAPPQPPAGPSEADQKFAEEYLHHFYGYQPEPDRRKRAAASRDDSHQTTGFCDKVKKMQRSFGLTPDGKLSQETLTVMKKPRCGLSDVEPHGGAVRWTKRTISYRIAGENLPFPASRTLKAIRTALKLWSSVSLVRFRRREAKEADVSIAFVSGADHGDGSPFSGKGGALAHAFLPGLGIGGDVHFDSAEEWTLNYTGISLPVVAAHEFGHALGLSHSSDLGSVMYPAYNFAPSLELSFDDVKSIQHLYGENPNFHLQSLKRPPPKTPDKCDPDLSFDAVTELQQEVVFFKDRFMWRKHPSFVETRIALISSLWSDSVPSHLDAVYENVEKNFILFFKGDQYWKVQQLILQEGFPRNISDLGFPSRIKSVDAALHFRDDRYTVFFTGHECWRYNELRAVMEGSPMLIEQQWLEIPFPVDAAVYYEGFVNFFKGNKQYKYDFGQNHVVSVSSANDLMDCEMGKSNKHAL